MVNGTSFVQSTHKKKDKTVFGVSYRFIRIAASKYQGIIKEGSGGRLFQFAAIFRRLCRTNCDIPMSN
jgi:hypothetical protein